ncbi:hypothetical protein [Trinickia sp.]|uniref:hypothetical protein n=1 Tax=Trinickia sp. TaxID=2571163 RepID=UPI003F7E3FDE
MLIAAVLLGALCYFFVPLWETNDDIAMSMVAHGYGIAKTASPNLIFSNVLWGYLVRSLPSVGGVLGYSIASMASLFVAWAVVLYCMWRWGSGVLWATTISSLLFVRAVLFPQFTVNSGLLTTAAVLAVLMVRKGEKSLLPVIGILLAFCGFLVRAEEFALVAGVAAPVLIATRFYRSRLAVLSAAVLAMAVVGAGVYNHLSYQGPDWQYYESLNAARAPITDFNMDQKLLQRPDILGRFGYTKNDIELVRNFFFVDHHIANPVVLKEMLTALGARWGATGDLSSGLDAMKLLWDPQILPILAAAAVFFLLAPNWPIGCAWILFLATLFGTGFMGRGALVRVEWPVVALLFALSTFKLSEFDRPRRAAREWMKRVTVLIAVISLARVLYPMAIDAAHTVATNEAAVARFPREVVVAWGAGLPFESIFPPLANDAQVRTMNVMPFGVFTYAPFSVAFFEEKRGQGFVNRIRSKAGILIVADKPNMERLNVWCAERFGGTLKTSSAESAPYIKIDRVWCVNSDSVTGR